MVMKLFLLLILVGLAVCLFFAYLSITAKAPESGLVQGQLKPCPDSPNCVSSEQGTAASHRVEALYFEGAADAAWQDLKQAIAALGGKIREDQGEYLQAEFSSRIFRFVDDLECRMQAQDNLIHVRSASRAGRSDLGVNRKRVEELRRLFQGGDSR
ncbi:DUF1499 domain-containing protein [Thiolapillus sp.]